MQVWDAGQFWQAASGVRGNGCGVISIFHAACDQGSLPPNVNSPSDLFSAVAAFAAHGGPGDAVFRALVFENPSFVDNHVQGVLDPLRNWAVDPFGSRFGDYELYRDRYAFAGGHMWQEVEIQLVATYLGHAIRVRSSYDGQDQRTFYPVTVLNGAATPVIGMTTPLEIFHAANHFQPVTTAASEALHQPAIHADQLLLFLRQNEVMGPLSGCAANTTGSLCKPLLRGGADKGGGGGGGGGEAVNDDPSSDEEEDPDGCTGFCDSCGNSQCKGHDPPPQPLSLMASAIPASAHFLSNIFRTLRPLRATRTLRAPPNGFKRVFGLLPLALLANSRAFQPTVPQPRNFLANWTLFKTAIRHPLLQFICGTARSWKSP